jgi:hypothetical protein
MEAAGFVSNRHSGGFFGVKIQLVLPVIRIKKLLCCELETAFNFERMGV